MQRSFRLLTTILPPPELPNKAQITTECNTPIPEGRRCITARIKTRPHANHAETASCAVRESCHHARVAAILVSYARWYGVYPVSLTEN